MSRRVLMTADAVGGVWTYALDLVRELPEVEIALAVMGHPLSEGQAAEASALKNLTVHAKDYRLEWMEEPWEDVRAAGDWLLELEGQFRPDVVHLNGLVHGGLPFRAPKLAVVHSCVLSWWQAVKGELAPASWLRYAQEARNGLQGADVVVAPSQAMMTEAVRLYGPFRRSEVVPNGRSGIAPATKEPFVFSAGRMWDEAKNVQTLESVAVQWPIVIAGEGSTLGRLSPAEVADHMGRASIYALPARYEPFGLSVLEAALAGCALVLGDIPSLRENWDGVADFVPPDDRPALEAAIQALIDDSESRNLQARRARDRALSLSVERFAQHYRELYESVSKASVPGETRPEASVR